MSEENNGDEQTKRRSQTKKELDAFAKIVAILKPLNDEQRKRIIAAAHALLEP